MVVEPRPPADIWQALLIYTESVLLEPTPAQAKALAQVLVVLGALEPGDLTISDAPITQAECLNTIPYSRIALQLIPVPLACHVKVEVRFQEDTASPWVPVLGLDLKTRQLLVWCPPQLSRVVISKGQMAKLLAEGEKVGRDPMPRVQFSGSAEEWGLCDRLLKIS